MPVGDLTVEVHLRRLRLGDERRDDVGAPVLVVFVGGAHVQRRRGACKDGQAGGGQWGDGACGRGLWGTGGPAGADDQHDAKRGYAQKGNAQLKRVKASCKAVGIGGWWPR